ncbi:LOW QUALITY PROTEIN: tectonic-1 [Discoglossus pictus]
MPALYVCLWLLCSGLVFVEGTGADGPPKDEEWGGTEGPFNVSAARPEDPAGTADIELEVENSSAPSYTEAPAPSHTTEHVITQPPISVRDPQLRAFPAPVTSVAALCVCDLLVSQCDGNCCCDPDCSASDFSVFSECSVSVVKGDGELCTQEAVFYSINSSLNIPQRTVQTVELNNPKIFCIQTINYEPALSFITPSVPAENDFDILLKEFGGVYFNTETDGQNSVASATSYKYSSPIQTADNTYLKIPAPLGTKACTDNNPVGFLVNQDFTCSRSIQIENCSIPELTLGTYTKVRILALPNLTDLVNITVKSILMKSLNGTLSPGTLNDKTPQWDSAAGICTDVVLGGSYLVTYTDQGKITNVAASFFLGAINRAMVPLQQHFQINFIQEHTAGLNPSPLSGNPGYVFGLPLVAGFKSQYPIIQSSDRFGQLSILKSSSDQSCLSEEGNRAAVLFGYNVVSGCTLRYTSTTICQLAADTALNVLKGQQFPDYVASFGNSQPQNVLDWVPITVISPTEQGSIKNTCKIPVSFELEVRWTKYGSLVNPQAKIVNMTQKMTYASIPVSGSDTTLQISSSALFVDVSAPAEPGYKAQPTIDAKLPFDFFYPFV